MKKWLVEIEDSLNQALEVAYQGSIPLENLFMLAPVLYSQRQKMNNDAVLKQMVESTEKMVAQDVKDNEDSIYQYRFHFVSTYLYCFVVAGRFDELQYDRIMEYVNDNIILFTDDYGQ